ncbi:MAG: hypothetical protein KAU95_01040, partial [Candidatus Aenigmarchaeota archaeon]|nr:hypothetical protein [Candidatus Aenigmarchaeota archaeon]
KKFGKKTSEVAKLIEQLKVEEVNEKMKIGEFEIEKDDLIIKQKSMEGTEFSKGYVTLDLAEDEELKEERFLRELIREIQKKRQEEKLNVLDKINLFLEDKEFIKKFEDKLKEEVRAEKIVYELKEKMSGVEYKDLSLEFGFKKE